jgi:hypothetical protein
VARLSCTDSTTLLAVVNSITDSTSNNMSNGHPSLPHNSYTSDSDKAFFLNTVQTSQLTSVLVTPFGVKKLNNTIPHMHLAAGLSPYSISKKRKCRSLSAAIRCQTQAKLSMYAYIYFVLFCLTTVYLFQNADNLWLLQQLFCGRSGVSRIVRSSEFGISMVEYIDIYKAVQLKSKIQQTGTWMPAAWLPRHLVYRPEIFFRNMRLFAVPFSERKIQSTLQKCNYFIVSTFLKLYKYENNA